MVQVLTRAWYRQAQMRMLSAGLCLGISAIFAVPDSAAAQEACPIATAPTPAPSLPRSRAAIEAKQELVVVAFGSSSTQSYMASDPAHSYPAVLQEELSRALPSVHVAVVNRGVGGQDAAEELARLQTDVLALRPQLVIWQVGANGVLRQTEPAVFQALVRAGIDQIQGAKVDMVLMDNQRAPSILAQSGHERIEAALGALAKETGISLFSRGALMDAWQRQGQPYARFISADGLHHNDLGYRCVAQALSQWIVAGLTAGRPEIAGGADAGAGRMGMATVVSPLPRR